MIKMTITPNIGDFVAFKYEGKLCPGVGENFDEIGATIRSMTKSLKAWNISVKKDVFFYEWKYVIGAINPTQKNKQSRVFYSF
jgi:hypothetical protein